MTDEAGGVLFEFTGGRLCLDLVNTRGRGPSGNSERGLSGYADLLAWGRQAGLLPGIEGRAWWRNATLTGGRAAAGLRAARGLRRALREVFTAVVERRPPRASDLALISRTLVAALARQRIVHHGQSVAWQWTDDAGIADRILGPVARSAAEVLASADLGRVRRCAEPGCGWFFFDLTRNHTRRWCNMARCGNRAKARRFYARRIKGQRPRRSGGQSAPGRPAGTRSGPGVRARPRP